MRASASRRFGLTRFGRKQFTPDRRSTALGRFAWAVALAAAFAVPALLVFGDTAGAVPAAALLGAQGPVPGTQFGAELRGGGVLQGNTPRRILHFTFDDGPDAEHTPKLLDALDRAGFKATFFFSTSRFDGKQRRNDHAPGMAIEVARRGHQLGVHGFDHVRMGRLRPPELQHQVEQTEEMFARVFGTRTFLFRPPFGSRNAKLDAMLADSGYVTAMWNIGMADWVERDPALVRTSFWRAIERNAAESGDRGGIVLMHDTHAWSVAAFELIADSIHARNCELLAAGEELYDVADSMAPWVHPASAAGYAARQTALGAQLKPGCERLSQPAAARRSALGRAPGKKIE